MRAAMDRRQRLFCRRSGNCSFVRSPVLGFSFLLNRDLHFVPIWVLAVFLQCISICLIEGLFCAIQKAF